MYCLWFDFIATKELNIYQRNWAVSKIYVNTELHKKEREKMDGCVMVTMKEIQRRSLGP